MKVKSLMICLLLLSSIGLAGCVRLNKAAKKYPYDPGKAKPAQVSMNKLPLADPDSEMYRFLVIGHGYGGVEVEDQLPDPALLSKVPEIRDMDLSMLVSLGDIVWDTTPENFDNLETYLLQPLPFPVFNTVGNHDVKDRSAYTARYGDTFYSFRAGPAQMIFLDTERETCAIDDVQQKMLEDVVARSLRASKIRHIFIFMHKTLFFSNQMLAEINQPVGLPNVIDCYASEDFAGILEETLLPAAQKKPILLFAGDVGAWANLTPYYEKRTDADLTMVMTGLGDNPDNSAILVTVDRAVVHMEIYSLTGQPVQPLETYTPEYWIQLVSP